LVRKIEFSGEIYDIELSEELLEENRKIAEENKKKFQEYGVRVIEVRGSIGSGKTSLIESLVEVLSDKYEIGVMAGDVTTTIDAERLEKKGAKVVQINTGGECHLDANLVRKAINVLDPRKLDLIFIENVGNLICPADFPLGSQQIIVVVSVTEGPYTIVKHPMILEDADLLFINKIDLAEAMDVNPSSIERDALRINPKLKVVKGSLKEGMGVQEVLKSLNLT